MRKKQCFKQCVPLCLVALVSGLLLGSSEGADGQLKPLSVEAVLKAMPKAPENWKLTKSTAETYFSDGMVTRGVREFEYSPPDPEAPNRGATCRLELLDTAGNAKELSRFKNFKEEQGDGYQKIVVKSFPAIVREIPNYGTSVSLMANKRYRLNILLKGLPLNQVGAWIEATNFAALASVPDESMPGELFRVEVTVLDELNPDKNRTYTQMLSDREATAASSDFYEDPNSENEPDVPEPPASDE
ncbi:MAG: hypothetical protein AAF591_04035 [Verrucomicrobiota bacterium]